MAGTIVCGVDDSQGARWAVQVAARLAEALDAELVLVHVAPTSIVPGASAVPGGAQELRELALEEAEALLARVGGDTGQTSARRMAVVGPAVEVLRQAAVDEDALLIVVGSRGQGHLRASLLGSVSGGLGRSAPCPVVIVPPHATLERVRPPQGDAGSAAAERPR